MLCLHDPHGGIGGFFSENSFGPPTIKIFFIFQTENLPRSRKEQSFPRKVPKDTPHSPDCSRYRSLRFPEAQNSQPENENREHKHSRALLSLLQIIFFYIVQFALLLKYS
jgi:hypothetical protein